MRYCIGIDIGGTKCSIVSADITSIKYETENTFLTKEVLETNPFSPDEMLEKICAVIDSVLASYPASEHEFAGIGISCGGPLNAEKGIIQCPPNLPGWVDVPITDILKEKYHCRVVIENDANACAIAEWKFGAARGYRNAIFLTFGTGLGAGLILDGKLYRGANDMAGEVGHISISDFGPVGYGKTGSLEGFCSGGGITQLAKLKLTEALQTNSLPSWCPTPDDIGVVNAKLVAEAADQGDPLAKEIYKESGTALGKGLAIIVDILNPDIIVIGSIYQRSEHLLAPYALKELQKLALSRSAQACQIVPAQLANNLGDYAAISLICD